jgi:SMODS and SLOG-associating 2TM effector domain 3
MQELTMAAIEAVGADQPSDWELRPENHIAALKNPAAAAPLVELLKNTELVPLVNQYVSANRQAIAAQATYKRYARLSAMGSLLAVVIASIMLLPRVGGISDETVTTAAVLQFLLLLLSFITSLWLAWRKPYDVWMRKRADAEIARIQLFRHVTTANVSREANGIPLLPLQLEYFRRFHLDIQRVYYRERGEQHKRAVRRRSVWRSVALIFVFVAAVPVLWTIQGKDWIPVWVGQWLALLPPEGEFAQRLFLCLGLIGGALQGFLAANALISYDDRNSARYAETRENLDDLAARPLNEAREAAAVGDRSRVYAFYALVDEQVSSEHREWTAIRRLVPDLSLDRLRELRLPIATR